MLPAQLTTESFLVYPPAARRLAVGKLALIQLLPLIFAPFLLNEIIEYDWKFPQERRELETQIAFLEGLTTEQRESIFAAFKRITLTSSLQALDWVGSPGSFVEQLTTFLWSSHQMDPFHAAADAFDHSWRAGLSSPAPELPRFGIAVIGQGVESSQYPLFRKLRPHGVCFRDVKPANGLNILLNFVEARAASHPLAFGHWYVDGGEPYRSVAPGLTHISFASLEPVRGRLLVRMQQTIQSGSGGPEALRTELRRIRPKDLGMTDEDNAMLNRFQVSLLTEGSGTQIFSTTFVQWGAREVLRRAQPCTLLTRYAPRQRQQPMNELLTPSRKAAELDPAGSLIDADMGAYYTWLNLQRLSGAEQSRFLVWFEGRDEALAIAPTLPRGTTASSAADLRQILSWMT